jgi:anti-anti-sigma regulatory factor
VLRITRIAGAGSAAILKLEGELLEPWVGEVRQACADPAAGAGRTRLDLSALTFVDAVGAELLRHLIRQGVEITACSSFVAELLHVN